MKKIKEKSIDFEIRFCEGILKRSPTFVQALSMLGDLYTKKGRFQSGLMIDEQLSRLKPDDPIVFYNLACSYSLTTEIDKAFWAIKKAIKFGYDDFSHLETDKDIENLRKDSRFQRYYRRIQKAGSDPK